MAEETLSIKRCTKCGTDKSFGEFTKDRQKKDGLRSQCRACAYADKARLSANSRRWANANRDKVNAMKRSAYWRDPEKHRTTCLNSHRRHRSKRLLGQKEYYRRNSEALLNKSMAYGLAHPEVARKAKRAWKERNLEMLRADRARRRAMEYKAAPVWADREKIRSIYRQCRLLTKETGIKHHVDHAVPLRNPFVCGLHCEFNLVIIPAIENMKKSNLSWPNMPSDLRGRRMSTEIFV